MDSTYDGGRRDVVVSHRYGVHACRSGAVHAFWVVLEGGTWLSPLTVFLPGGKEAIALFGGEEEARMFCHFSEEGAGTTIRQTTAGEVLSLLYCPWCSAKHVALDPFPEILGNRLLELLTLNRARFARRFAGVGAEPDALALRGGSVAPPLPVSPSVH